MWDTFFFLVHDCTGSKSPPWSQRVSCHCTSGAVVPACELQCIELMTSIISHWCIQEWPSKRNINCRLCFGKWDALFTYRSLPDSKAAKESWVAESPMPQLVRNHRFSCFRNVLSQYKWNWEFRVIILRYCLISSISAFLVWNILRYPMGYVPLQ